MPLSHSMRDSRCGNAAALIHIVSPESEDQDGRVQIREHAFSMNRNCAYHAPSSSSMRSQRHQEPPAYFMGSGAVTGARNRTAYSVNSYQPSTSTPAP
jgi:hypothetical protein